MQAHIHTYRLTKQRIIHTGQYIDNVAPATNSVFSRIPRSSTADVDAVYTCHISKVEELFSRQAVAAAKAAFKTWYVHNQA